MAHPEFFEGRAASFPRIFRISPLLAPLQVEGLSYHKAGFDQFGLWASNPIMPIIIAQLFSCDREEITRPSFLSNYLALTALGRGFLGRSLSKYLGRQIGWQAKAPTCFARDDPKFRIPHWRDGHCGLTERSVGQL